MPAPVRVHFHWRWYVWITHWALIRLMRLTRATIGRVSPRATAKVCGRLHDFAGWVIDKGLVIR